MKSNAVFFGMMGTLYLLHPGSVWPCLAVIVIWTAIGALAGAYEDDEPIKPV